MKRFALITCTAVLLLVLSSADEASASSSFSGHIGVDLYRYETSYLVTGGTLLNALRDDLELNLGALFGIATSQDNDGNTVPSFLIPVDFGLNFLFPNERVTMLLGTGLTPVFNINMGSGGETYFLMGPYLKAGARLKIHPVMNWFVEAQQDLLIGGPEWINTATRLTTGINFTLSTP